MADQEKDRQIDKMLDSLLANYSSAEPRPGLETRILANLRQAEKRAPEGWWNFKWIWAGVVAAAAVIMVVALLSGRHQATPPTNAPVETRRPAPQPQIQPRAPVAPQTAARVHRHKPPAARQPQNAALARSKRPAVFPTPTPLSEQERLLLSYYSLTPREELIAQSHPDEPPVVGQSGPD